MQYWRTLLGVCAMGTGALSLCAGSPRQRPQAAAPEQRSTTPTTDNATAPQSAPATVSKDAYVPTAAFPWGGGKRLDRVAQAGLIRLFLEEAEGDAEKASELERQAGWIPPDEDDTRPAPSTATRQTTKPVRGPIPPGGFGSGGGEIKGEPATDTHPFWPAPGGD